jgi:hypothetical protein
VPVKFIVSRSELTVEAGYQRPQFGLFRDESRLLPSLAERLSVHGLKLADMKIERGSGTLGEMHLLCYLVDYVLTVRIRVERVEIYCSPFTDENKKPVIAAALETLNCVRESLDGDYRAYAMSMNIHGLLENQSGKAFLARLVSPPPPDAGPVVGNGVAYYFASSGDRIASSLALDVSAIATDGLFARPQATWDSSRLPLDQLAERAEDFVRRTLGSFDIEVP